MAELVIPYKPFPVHLPVHLSGAREKAMIGAVGSGKTLGMCGEAIRWANELAGRRLMICRDTVPSLRDTTEAELIAMLSTPPDEADPDEVPITLWEIIENERLVKRSGGHVDHFYFPNGSQVMFRSLDKWSKIMSYNLSFIGVDEANEITFETYVNLVSRLRQNQPTGMARRQGVVWTPEDKGKQSIVLASNSHGHNWIWENFINNPTVERRYFRSTSFDNPTLYTESGELSPFLRNLLSMPPIWVRRFVMCEHDSFEGQIFDYSPIENVYTHFEPPGTWERAMGLDWGIRNPTACVWLAREPGSSKWFLYREWQTYDPTNLQERDSFVTMNVSQVANKIKELEAGEVVRWRAADPMIWRRQTTHTSESRSINDWFRQNGLTFQPGAKGYDDRIQAVNEPMSRRNLVISTACPQTQVALQQYRWEDLKIDSGETDPREKPVKKNDHLVDATEYILSLFMASRSPSDAAVPVSLDEHLRAQIRQQVKRQYHKLGKRARL